jgi:glycosyltransferase involved in cell wall biosynthesis
MPPRVLQLVLSLSPGGTERLVIEICRRLSGGAHMSVCCLDEPGAWASDLTQEGIEVTSLGRRGGFEPSLARAIARVVDRQRIDIIHSHHYSPFVYSALAKLLRPAVGLVFTEHGRLSDAPPSMKRRVVNPLLSKLPNAICAVSQDLRQHLIDSGFPARRIEVVYNGVPDLPPPTPCTRRGVRASLGVPDDDTLILSIGRLDPVKNFPLLLCAFANVLRRDPNVWLAIVGDGPERADLEQQVRDLSLYEHVKFTGYRQDVSGLLAAADVYVNSSVFEGVSLTILEAMAAGLPVVATAVGGNPEVVAHERTGLLASSASASIADAIHRLAVDDQLRRRFGAAGRARVAQDFSMDRMMARYAELYQMYSANRNSAR